MACASFGRTPRRRTSSSATGVSTSSQAKPPLQALHRAGWCQHMLASRVGLPRGRLTQSGLATTQQAVSLLAGDGYDQADPELIFSIKPLACEVFETMINARAHTSSQNHTGGQVTKGITVRLSVGLCVMPCCGQPALWLSSGLSQRCFMFAARVRLQGYF